MRCAKCGAETFSDTRVCGSCGQILADVTDPAADAVPSRCGWATAALVLAILSLLTCMLTALPAVICGIVALVKISGARGRLKGIGSAIVGIALPIIAVPLIPLILAGAALLLGHDDMTSALANTRNVAYKMVCRTNLAVLGKAMAMYADENEGLFPTPARWCDLLIEEAGVSPRTFQCHGGGAGRCHYAMNENAEALSADIPADVVLLFETDPGWNQVGGPDIFTSENHEGEGCHVLFADGHVEFIRPARLHRLHWGGSAATTVYERQGNYQRARPKQPPGEQAVEFPEDEPTRVVEIVGNVPGVDFSTWQHTGVSLRSGDVLYIQAEGEINYVAGFTVTPDGRGQTFSPALLSGVSSMALVGRTHWGLLDDGIDSSGVGLYGPGFVGSAFTTTYRGVGSHGLTGDNVLYLAVNDSMDNDNALSFTVRIWIVRDGQVVRPGAETEEIETLPSSESGQDA